MHITTIKLALLILFLTIVTAPSRAQDGLLTKSIALKEPWKQAEVKFSAVHPRSTLTMGGKGYTIIQLGKEIEIDKNGFPKQISTFYNQDLTEVTTTSHQLLAENIHFHFVRKSDGKNIKLQDAGPILKKIKNKIVQWEAESWNDSLKIQVYGTMKADGVLNYIVKVSALADIELKEVTMHIPFEKTAANYLATSTQQGLRPERLEWKWGQQSKHRIWTGNANRGLSYTLLAKPGYANAWANHGLGGGVIAIKGSSMLANNFTGEHNMRKGDILYYNFSLTVTPKVLPD